MRKHSQQACHQNHPIWNFSWSRPHAHPGVSSVTFLLIATVFSGLLTVSTMAALTNIMKHTSNSLFCRCAQTPVFLSFVSCSTLPFVVLSHFATLHAGTSCAVVLGFQHLPSSPRQSTANLITCFFRRDDWSSGQPDSSRRLRTMFFSFNLSVFVGREHHFVRCF